MPHNGIIRGLRVFFKTLAGSPIFNTHESGVGSTLPSSLQSPDILYTNRLLFQICKSLQPQFRFYSSQLLPELNDIDGHKIATPTYDQVVAHLQTMAAPNLQIFVSQSSGLFLLSTPSDTYTVHLNTNRDNDGPYCDLCIQRDSFKASQNQPVHPN